MIAIELQEKIERTSIQLLVYNLSIKIESID